MPRILVHGLLVVLAAIGAVVGHESLAYFPSTAASATGVARGERPRAAVANLDPALLGALRRAETDAAGAGIEFDVTSGWRSPERQQGLLDQAVAEHGSLEEAARWVATPDTSPHVSGDAVDLGPDSALAWLSKRGAAYGLCQIYDNEPWHFELRTEAVEHGCPPTYPDPTHDPRMQQ